MLRTPAERPCIPATGRSIQEPGIGLPTDEARLQAIGDEGVDVPICDSTNIVREGQSPSEGEVARTLEALIAKATAGWSSRPSPPIWRAREGGGAGRRSRRPLGRRRRPLARPRDRGRPRLRYLDGIKPFFGPQSYSDLPRDRVVVLATGSQGEPRAAMARIGGREHPAIKLANGDTVIFSSRTIPATSAT